MNNFSNMNQLLNTIKQSGKLFPEKIALSDSHHELTYRELLKKIEEYQHWLKKTGFRPGEVAIIQLPNRVNTVILVLSLCEFGVVPLFSAPALRTQEIAHLQRLSGANHYIFSSNYTDFDYLKQAEAIANNNGCCFNAWSLKRDKPELKFAQTVTSERPDVAKYMIMITSSGSTGLPKIIAPTPDQLWKRVVKWETIFKLDSDHRFMAYLSIMYPMTLHAPLILSILAKGGSVYLTDRVDCSLQQCLAILDSKRITHTALVPSFAREFLETFKEENYNLSALDIVEIGGEPLTDELAEEIKKTLGCSLFELYGMSEGFGFATTRSDIQIPLDRTKFEYKLDTQIEDVAREQDGKRGELLIKGEQIFSGYFNQDNRNFFTEDGFFKTGYIVEFKGEGVINSAVRKKDVVNKFGTKINCIEIEHILESFGEIRRAVVVGIPDKKMGQSMCAFLVGDRISNDTLRKKLVDIGLAEFKFPDQIRYLSTLPLNARLKVDRSKLIEMAQRS
jgi:2,3-dihydroxybenzoate-AMP ligase